MNALTKRTAILQNETLLINLFIWAERTDKQTKTYKFGISGN